ncbi:hypothetical protein [Levilactobacillus brevis]|uniref:hypothetical protein n=1 Tax=Levilactobacillus brevis TaxID=1580 RepID=UPI000BEAC7B0|nr:hypothetical protein [Levilactobacillus brevis]MCZ2118645.1 hypothetical protein [Levilactobacillus brevis]MCZ2124171.1 hypothetical protein [Levilactobacillus brevis]MCZ2208491.1 hypothetical protein [Levilactobacillus brevis]MCZ2323955.1 hypothetical protein [Levilactobacillus brevis]
MTDKAYTPEYNLEDLLNELPVSLAYEEDSNNAKLLSLYSDGMEDTLVTLQKMDEWHSIDIAEGEALDVIGNDCGVPRNGYDDEFYRFLIKSKQLQRQTDGTYSSLIKLIAESLGAKYSEINVGPVNNEPNAIQVTNVPATYIDSQRKEKLVLDQIRSSVAAGIRVAGIGFQKTVKSTLYYAMQFQTTQVIESTMSVPQLKEG